MICRNRASTSSRVSEACGAHPELRRLGIALRLPRRSTVGSTVVCSIASRFRIVLRGSARPRLARSRDLPAPAAAARARHNRRDSKAPADSAAWSSSRGSAGRPRKDVTTASARCSTGLSARGRELPRPARTPCAVRIIARGNFLHGLDAEYLSAVLGFQHVAALVQRELGVDLGPGVLDQPLNAGDPASSSASEDQNHDRGSASCCGA